MRTGIVRESFREEVKNKALEDVHDQDRHREKKKENVLPTKGNDASRIMDEYGGQLSLASWLD